MIKEYSGKKLIKRYNPYNKLFQEKTTILHFAPEEVLAEIFVAEENMEYVGADIDPELPFVSEKIDIQNIKYNDETFDLLFCSHVLEHVPDDQKLCRNCSGF